MDSRHPNLLITGATGMVGACVLARLLRSASTASTGGESAHCVIARGKGTLTAERRIDSVLAPFEKAWGITLPRPKVLSGDINQPNVGLSKKSIDWVRSNCQAVLHSAASLSFAPASESETNEPFRTNVGGTENVVKLADACGLSDLHYVSTAYVCGKQRGRVLESWIDAGQEFSNDYESSKVDAELLAGRSWLAGHDDRTLTVYRPSIIVDTLGLTPVSGDRTIYGAFSMFQMLAGRFGMPREGEWFRNLGFGGSERKNLIDVHWVAEAIETVLRHRDFYGQTYHLTARRGTSVAELEDAFRLAAQENLRRRKFAPGLQDETTRQSEIDQLAAPFVKTFLPYFGDDPNFDRSNIDTVVAATDLSEPPHIGTEAILKMTHNWTAPASRVVYSRKETSASRDDEVVVCGYEVRLPGGVDDARAFERLLFRGESAIEPLPPERLDRDLYFDERPGTPGKTYTEIGGCVDREPRSAELEREIEQLGSFDLTHRHFAQVAVAAMSSVIHRSRLAIEMDLSRAGVFVGHSGGTESGGALALATLARSATRFIETTRGDIGESIAEAVRTDVTESLRRSRPKRGTDGSPELNAYAAASLAARLLGFRGRREVIDAACSSSLVALQHAVAAIDADRLDLAVVGGATFNNVDNLALFSQTGACSASGSYPFDSRASGLVSSEGYVAVVVARRGLAEAMGMPVLSTIRGVGISSDGKGKGLWAPRSEGQQLAMRRGADATPLEIDYLECHATSTQVGDATELESLRDLLARDRDKPLPIGSAKSNLGHLLEAAGMVGLVKCLIAMRRGQLPPSIHFESPTETFDWQSAPIRVVNRVESWPTSTAGTKAAAVNAFGIGGLNAHAVFEQSGERPSGKRPSKQITTAPLAIVGRGLVLPGAVSIDDFATVLRDGQCLLSDPPADRWPHEMNSTRPIGLSENDEDYCVPHARAGFVREFTFDAQAYRIPPKMVANANPAQLMLIESVRQAIEEFDGGQWTIDRQRVAVAIGTMFGGQFSNELQIGLRLPEICREIRRAASQRGVDPELATQWAESYRNAALEAYPALLDETGGFTASTLASRIARTFDLMGGAFAVDADEASGGLAILTAAEQLARGDIDAVLCGTASRAIDLVALEQLHRNGRLARSNSIDALSLDPATVFPAEGAALMMLMRLDDAKQSGRPILGVLDHIGESFVDDVRTARMEESTSTSARLVRSIGHLGGGHGVVRAIAETLDLGNGSSQSDTSIVETASDGYQVIYSVSRPDFNVEANRAPSQSAPVTLNSSPHVLTAIIDAADPESLEQRLRNIGPSDYAPRPEPLSLQRCVAVVVARDADELRGAAQELIKGPIAKGVSGASDRYAAWVRMPSVRGDRIAWTFPGQGSQYAGEPSLFELPTSGCRQSIKKFDGYLKSLQLAPIGDRLSDPERQLGRDVWWTQAWVLAVGTALTDHLLDSGLRPDVVLGHSFGECTAAWAAGAMNLRQTIEFARARSEAVTVHGGPRGELLSVRGAPSQVASVLQEIGSPCVITHHNATQQTVIAGGPDAVTAAKEQLSKAGLASVVIPVPAAFHTPGMATARDVLKTKTGSFALRPPRFAFLSATQNRYLAEPDDIRTNLIDQLVQPVGFSGAIERLVRDGCGLILEVGPNNVLTRLAASTVSDQALCLSLDNRSVPAELQEESVKWACRLFREGIQAGSPRPLRVTGPTQDTISTSTDRVESTNPAAPTASANVPSKRGFAVVDVTRRGRRLEAPRNETTTEPSNGRASSPTPTTQSEPIASVPVTSSVGNESARSFLFDLVVDLTGYEPEIIDFDADLEAELGVDSIKKAQLIGELVQWANLSVTTQDIKLADYRSMADILALVPNAPQAAVSVAANVPQVANGPKTVATPSVSPASASPPIATVTETALENSEAEIDGESLQRFMIDLLVDQTGYDEDIIDMDADLEGELGVDSIKRAQLLGELSQQYDLPAIQLSDLKLSDFPTLASIHAFIMDQASSKKKSLLR
ncbi:MAG: beta-ketoacyl synthase N-terminal-like domain-containing protein [Planctomycetota bacterium]